MVGDQRNRGSCPANPQDPAGGRSRPPGPAGQQSLLRRRTPTVCSSAQGPCPARASAPGGSGVAAEHPGGRAPVGEVWLPARPCPRHARQARVGRPVLHRLFTFRLLSRPAVERWVNTWCRPPPADPWTARGGPRRGILDVWTRSGSRCSPCCPTDGWRLSPAPPESSPPPAGRPSRCPATSNVPSGRWWAGRTARWSSWTSAASHGAPRRRTRRH
jgi:hypothetical protein